MANRWLLLTLGLCAWSLWPRAAAAEGDAVPLLVDKLEKSDSFRVRTQAAAVLGRLNDARAVEPLLRSLKNDDSYAVRGAAAGALGHVGGAPAVDALFTALSDDDSFVRSLSEGALYELSGPGVATAMRGHMFDGGVKERAIAFKRLLKLAEAGDAAAVGIMVEALAIKEFRADSEQLLGRLPGERVVPLLLPALKADEAEMRVTAVRLLMLHPSPDVVDALGVAYSRSAEDESVRSEVRRALIAMANFVDVADLVQTARSPDLVDDERARAIRLLGVLADPTSMVTLEELLDDSEPFIRGVAALGLADAGARQSLPKLEKMRQDPSNERLQVVLDAVIRKLKQ